MKDEQKYYHLMIAAICFSSFSMVLSKLATLLGTQPVLGKYLYYAVFIFLLVRCCIQNLKFFGKCVAAITFFSFLLVLNYAIFSLTRDYIVAQLDRFVQMFFVYVPAGLAFFEIHDYKKLLRTMETPVFVAMILLCSVHMISRLDSMEFGLRLSVLYLLALACYRKNMAVIKKILLFVGFFFNFMAGRQALIIVLAGVLALLLFNIQKSRKKNVWITVGAAGATVFVVGYQYILRLFVKVLVKLGISGRGVESLISGSVLDASNREWIYDIMIDAIQTNKFKINGLFADRYFLDQNSYRRGYYAHNIIFEILVDFGWIVGLAILIFMVYRLFLAFKISRNEERRLLVFMILFTFIRLFVSGAFLIEGNFYLVMLLAEAIIYRKKETPNHFKE